jgi:hypothetical protein
MSEGERAIDVIRRASSLGRRELVVPEWEDMKLYFNKITGADWEAIEAMKPKTDMRRNLLMLTRMAKTETGEPAFTSGDIEYLKTEAALDVLQRVMLFMFEGLYDSIETAVEEIEGNECSDSGSS